MAKAIKKSKGLKVMIEALSAMGSVFTDPYLLGLIFATIFSAIFNILKEPLPDTWYEDNDITNLCYNENDLDDQEDDGREIRNVDKMIANSKRKAAKLRMQMELALM